MISGLIHDNLFDYFYTLIVDILIFTIKSIYFFAETIYLTILPNKLRKLKVRWNSTVRSDSKRKKVTTFM